MWFHILALVRVTSSLLRGVWSQDLHVPATIGCWFRVISIIFIVPKDVDGMIYSMWMGTVVCMSFGILFSAAAALFAVINTAITPISFLTGISGLYLWNFLSIVFQGSALGLWVGHYFKRLYFNVMSAEDRADLMWTSEGRAKFGFSFWMIVVSMVVHFINILFIFSGTKELRQKKTVKPIIEEKGNGAIMLY